MNRTWPRVLGLLGLAGLAWAQTAKLELNGQAQLLRANKVTVYARSGGSPLTLGLEPGDRVCLTKGNGELSFGLRKYSLSAAGPACFEVARPPSVWQTMLETCRDLGVCKKQAQTVFAKEARGKGGLSEEPPTLDVPTTYMLPSLSLPIESNSLPKTLSLFDPVGQELYQQELGSDTAFTLPMDKVRKAVRLEVRSGSGRLLYGGRIQQVIVDLGSATNPREQALQLFSTRSLGYAPAAYSYLLAARERELAAVVEAQIRAEFKGLGR